jgi:hypothetical protein
LLILVIFSDSCVNIMSPSRFKVIKNCALQHIVAVQHRFVKT